MDLKSHQLDFNVPANASTWASLEELFEKMNLMTEDREMANGTYRVSREEF